MIKYTLEGRAKKGEWRKYCDFTSLSSLDTLVKEMSSQNYLLKCNVYKVTKSITIQSVVCIGNIIEPPKEIKI